MKKLTTILLASMAVMALSCQKNNDNEEGKFHPQTPEELPDKPEVIVKDGSFYVNGEPFFIKGAAINGDNLDSDGNQEFWKEAKQAGANTVRMYSVNNESIAFLDEMAKKGVYVNLGIGIARECEGFDYNDENARKKQLSSVKSLIDKIADHPAILMWCIGNELDQNNKVDGSGTISLNVNVWKDVNEISEYIHKNDGRPTTTALTGTWDKTITEIKTYVPDIDFLCINAYDPGIYDVHSSLKSQNFDKPYIISEFGPLGTWEDEVKKTEWGCMLESTGTEKAAAYKKLYDECIVPYQGQGCLGSYVFLWGYQSHGDVLTWYAMFDQFQKQALPAATAMSELWTGAPAAKKNPVISAMTLEGKTADKNVKIPSAALASAQVSASSPDGAALTYDWRIIRDVRLENGKTMSGISGLIQGKPDQNLSFKAPSKAGNYRLIVFVRDAANGLADVAVFPFNVTESGEGGGSEDLEDGELGGESIDGWEKGHHIK